MRVLRTNAVALGLLVLSASCAVHTPPRAGSDRNLLTEEQFSGKGFTSVFDVVESLRSNWMSTRGTDSFSSPSKVLVYLDGIRVGGVESLRAIDVRPVVYIRYIDGIAATGRWGLDHGSGVIYVSTHPMSPGGSSTPPVDAPQALNR